MSVILHQEINSVMSKVQQIDLLGLPQTVAPALTSRLRLASPLRVSDVTSRCDIRAVQWK